MLSSQSNKNKKKKSSNMMRKRQRGEVMEAPEIPFDLQNEILNRLPIKSLARFKCVSNIWSSFISSKGYLFDAPPRLYISLVEDIGNGPVLLTLTSTSSTAFDLDMTKQGIGGYDMVVLRGLILYTVDEQACIYNPTTGQRVTLPAIKSNILTGKEVVITHRYFLGYDPVIDHYKVVCAAVAWSAQPPSRIYAQHWVFVLEKGSSWKRNEFNQPHIPTDGGLCINGIIYILTRRRTFISFDVRSEEFKMIQIPSVANCWYMELIEYGGKPTIFDYVHMGDPSGLLNLWVLEDGGIWSKKSLVLQPCHMHFFLSSSKFQFIGTTQNGEVILKPIGMSYPYYYILYYDLDKNDVRRVDLRGIPDVRRVDMRGIPEKPFLMALMDTGVNIMHLKT